MHIEVLVQNPKDLNEICNQETDFEQVGYFQVEVEDGELEVLDIPYFDTCISNSNTKLIFIAVDDNLVVGALCIEHSKKGWDFGPNKWSMMNIGVSPSYENKGVSTLMIETMFSTMRNLGLSGICQSSYTVQGSEKIKKIFNRYAEKYPEVGFLDSNRIF